jgi:hypothetical protein
LFADFGQATRKSQKEQAPSGIFLITSNHKGTKTRKKLKGKSKILCVLPAPAGSRQGGVFVVLA